MENKPKQCIKVQIAIPKKLYTKIKQSSITGNIDDPLAEKIRILIKEYS